MAGIYISEGGRRVGRDLSPPNTLRWMLVDGMLEILQTLRALHQLCKSVWVKTCYGEYGQRIAFDVALP